jgi:integrase
MIRLTSSGLITATECYLNARDISPVYANNVRVRIRAYCDWVGSDDLAALDCSLANEWLATIGGSPFTVDGYRRALRCVWFDLYESGAVEEPPFRLRRIKKPRLKIHAYTHVEIMALAGYAARLAGYQKNGNKRADFWQSAILTAYSIGVRRGDLLDLLLEEVAPDRTLTCIQNKTGYPVRLKVSEYAWNYLQRLERPCGRLLPWPNRLDAFTSAFRRLRDRAGVTRGSFKWIRRAAGSYAEARRPGDGAKLLGQRSQAVFWASYGDLDIIGAEPVEPPPL